MAKPVGSAQFLKIVCQNSKCLNSRINSSVNISNKICQFFYFNCLLVLASFRVLFVLICYGDSIAKKLTSLLYIKQYTKKSISEVSWKRHIITITNGSMIVRKNSMKKLC